VIALFDNADLFERFCPRYRTDQHAFATRWLVTARHVFVFLAQREGGDAAWHVPSLAPSLSEARHTVTGSRVKTPESSWLHRMLWRPGLPLLPPAAVRGRAQR
jgi:hypothetical protein